MPKQNNRAVGAAYERLAASFLLDKGYEILEQNFRVRGGEIDLVARKDGMYVFCEVKFRRGGEAGHPLEAVDRRKQRQISKVAAFYLMKHGLGQHVPVRFDVIGIDEGERVFHVENAFPYSWRV